MIFSSLILSQLMVFFSPLHAETKVTVIENKDGSSTLSASLDPQDSETLYNILNLKELNGRSGFLKSFETKDKVFKIVCSKSKILVENPYNCSSYITNLKGTNPISELEDSFVAYIIKVDEASELFHSLDVETTNGRSGSTKEFVSSDNNSSISCGENISSPKGKTYACTAIISFN